MVEKSLAGFTAQPLNTERLLLEPLRVSHAEEMHAVLNDPVLHRFTGGRPFSLEELRERYAALSTQRSPDGHEAWLNWTVRLRDEGLAIGAIQASVRDESAEVAWVIGTAWQGNGFATEAAQLMISFLLSNGVHTITANIHPEHVASNQVALKAGLRPTSEVIEGEIVWRISPGWP